VPDAPAAFNRVLDSSLVLVGRSFDLEEKATVDFFDVYAAILNGLDAVRDLDQLAANVKLTSRTGPSWSLAAIAMDTASPREETRRGRTHQNEGYTKQTPLACDYFLEVLIFRCASTLELRHAFYPVALHDRLSLECAIQKAITRACSPAR
jgi:hypothetical protein